MCFSYGDEVMCNILYIFTKRKSKNYQFVDTAERAATWQFFFWNLFHFNHFIGFYFITLHIFYIEISWY